MRALKIVLLCMVSAIIYGICHDQVTARVCVEYFTVGHAPDLSHRVANVFAFGFGTMATWWVGLILGVLAALVSRAGSWPKLDATHSILLIACLLIVMAVASLLAGITGYELHAQHRRRAMAGHGFVIPGMLGGKPQGRGAWHALTTFLSCGGRGNLANYNGVVVLLWGKTVGSAGGELRCSVGFWLSLWCCSRKRLSPVAIGQMAGSRGGVEGAAATWRTCRSCNPKVAEGYITIEGRAEVRVRPTDVRVVLAVTSEAETAPEVPANHRRRRSIACRRHGPRWGSGRSGSSSTSSPFCRAMQWSPEKHGNIDAEVEKKVGYRMQTNVHLAANGEAEARAALAKALEQGITDIIAFDYWSKDLDDVKVKVRAAGGEGGAQQGRRPARRAFQRSAAGDQRAGADDGPLSRIAVPLVHQQPRGGGDRGHARATCRTSTPIVRATRTTAAYTATATCSPASCR